MQEIKAKMVGPESPPKGREERATGREVSLALKGESRVDDDLKAVLFGKLSNLKRKLGVPSKEGGANNIQVELPKKVALSTGYGASKYTLHITSACGNKKVRQEIDRILGGCPGARMAGAVQDEGGSIEIMGDQNKYRGILGMMKTMLRFGSPPIIDFSFTNLIVAKGCTAMNAALADETMLGKVALWAWAPDDDTWCKMEGSCWFNSQSKITTWTGAGKIRTRSTNEETYFLCCFNGGFENITRSESWDTVAEDGYLPYGVDRDGGSGDESDETIPEEDQIKDVTAGLPDVVMSEAWERDGPPKYGSGWWGQGAPLKVHHNYQSRDMEDGAGFCSPGRWPPARRNLPVLGNVGKDLLHAMGIKIPEFETTIYKMMASQQEDSPFSEEQATKGNTFLRKWCEGRGYSLTTKTNDKKGGPGLRLLQAFLRAALDPDAEALDAYCRGVEIGFKQRMPRAPAIYKEKTKWRLPYEDVDTPATEWAGSKRSDGARKTTHLRRKDKRRH